MNTLIGFTASQSFGQVRTSLHHVEALPLINLNLMLKNKAVLIADFGGIEPHSISPPIPLTANRSTDVAGVPRRI
jgi:hypothetical protein